MSTIDRFVLTKEARRELNATKERIEAGDSSPYELRAQQLILESGKGVKGALTTALKLYNWHNDSYSRRARKPAVVNGGLTLPKLIRDMEERDYP